ncbi:hypothetical protein PACTADRAFT_76892 [Pachysolen tannophilus NRRL Y-2460]|uniref:RanBD1 domain-containing protein n=1 Tax=Pachysolen tannophilus NRRL Y-2460 TaxID=669874 RepID=A0A1E4TRG5_PACTA|nr:hypothetical protein PACTADRAFT_76892 [Pachysolen tannophilus NRRL Y-2460]
MTERNKEMKEVEVDKKKVVETIAPKKDEKETAMAEPEKTTDELKATKTQESDTIDTSRRKRGREEDENEDENEGEEKEKDTKREGKDALDSEKTKPIDASEEDSRTKRPRTNDSSSTEIKITKITNGNTKDSSTEVEKATKDEEEDKEEIREDKDILVNEKTKPIDALKENSNSKCPNTSDSSSIETKVTNGDTNHSLKEAEKETKKDDEKNESKDISTNGTNSASVSASEEKPKFVFGSSTPFGSTPAFSMFNKKNIFDSSVSDGKVKEAETDSASSSSFLSAGGASAEAGAKNSVFGSVSPSAIKGTSAFGANSKFGNAFQAAINKKSIFDKEVKTESNEKEAETGQEQKKDEDEEEDEGADNDKDEDEDNNKDKSTKSTLYQKVHLEKKQISTGEEEDESLFSTKAKLYSLDLTNVAEGWKERGIGILRVNKLKNTTENINYKARIIMRADVILKVILNVPITKKFEIFEGMESSLASEKFIRISSIDENKKPVQYAIKTANANNTKALYNSIKSLIPKD